VAVDVLRYRHDGATAWGVRVGDGVVPVAGAYPTTGDFVREGAARARELAAAAPAPALALAEVAVLSPVTRNQQLVCQAINYRSHMLECGIDPDRQPYNVLFRKASSAIVPATAAVVRPTHVKMLDYELEVGLIVGREITAPVVVTHERLSEWVAALVVVNDVTARDVQVPQGQFYKGKSYRTFAPVGPHLTLVDAADLARLDDLRLRLWVNDELRQDARAGDMVFKPPATLSELSGLQDLFPGDLIATGTPAGCALQVPGALVRFVASLLPDAVRWAAFVRQGERSPRYLRPGDRLRAAIRTEDGALDLGVQENTVVAEGT
jgi:2,4-didehydro-3-deoxy-L-rhamnonate hydrolase